MSLSSLHRLLTGLVILWLAVFYPAMCQVHGLMLFRAPAPPAHQRHHPPNMDAPMEMSPVGHAAAPATGAPAMRHATLPVSVVVMSLLAMALPLETLFRLAPPAMSRRAIAPAFAHQVELSPPHEPPRFLPA